MKHALLKIVLFFTLIFGLHTQEVQEYFWEAIENKNFSHILTLINAELISIESKNSDGYTPLIWATIKNDLETVRFCIENNANVNMPDDNSITPLIWASSLGLFEVTQFLLKKGAHVNFQSNTGGTALFVASYMGNSNLIALLLEYGADPFIKNSLGSTPIDVAKEKGYSDIISLLEKAMTSS